MKNIHILIASALVFSSTIIFADHISCTTEGYNQYNDSNSQKLACYDAHRHSFLGLMPTWSFECRDVHVSHYCHSNGGSCMYEHCTGDDGEVPKTWNEFCEKYIKTDRADCEWTPT